MAKSKSKPDLTKVIGKRMSFRDMKTRKKVSLPVEYIKKYSLAKGSNKRRSKGRCSVIAFAHRGNRRVTRALGIFDCKNVSLTGVSRKKSRRSSRKKTRRSSRKKTRRSSRKKSRRSSRKKTRRSSRKKSRRSSRHCPKGCTKKSNCKRKH